MPNFCLSEAILERFKKVEDELGYSEHVINLDCAKIDTWEFRERKTFELGDIDELALSIQHGGQCQPIIVVRASQAFKPKEDNNVQYIVISGYRRWMACKKYNLLVQAIVKNLSLEQAVNLLVVESEKEKVSAYSKGMFYHSLLNTQCMTLEQLSKRLEIKPSTLHQYLAFARVPPKIWAAVGNLSRVSAKTAALIDSILTTNPEYETLLLSLAEKIAQGYAEKRIKRAMSHLVGKINHEDLSPEHTLKHNGKVIMRLHHGKIKLSDSVTRNGHYEELIDNIEDQVNHFAAQYLKNGRKAI